jgi:hypothetical protein
VPSYADTVLINHSDEHSHCVGIWILLWHTPNREESPMAAEPLLVVRQNCFRFSFLPALTHFCTTGPVIQTVTDALAWNSAGSKKMHLARTANNKIHNPQNITKVMIKVASY